MHTALLIALLACIFPGVFLHGERITAAGLLYESRPWSEYAPAGYEGPQNPIMSDIVTAFTPYYAVTQEALWSGEWPLWNPYEMGGMPLLANYQSAVFYPPRLLHAFLELHLATTLYILLKLWLCGMTAYVCGRALGWRTGVARFYSLAWMLSSYALVWSYWPLTDVAVWAPVVFLGIESVLGGRYRRGFFVLSIGGSLLLLAGHPETAFAFGLGMSSYFLWRLILGRGAGAGLLYPVAVYAAGWMLALGVAAVQLLPFAEYLAHSATSFGDERAGGVVHSLSAAVLAATWVPRFYGTSAAGTYWLGKPLNANLCGMLYTGMAVWVCVALLPVLWKKHAGEPGVGARVWALLIATALAVLLAIDMPPFDLVNRAPLLRAMRPAYHSVFALFALPTLAAISLEHWTASRRHLRDLARATPLIAVAALVVWRVWAFYAGKLALLDFGGHVRWHLGLGVALAVLCMGMLAVQCFTMRPRLVVALLTVVLAADLLYANQGLLPTRRADQVLPRTALTDYLRGLPQPCRVDAASGGIASGLLAPYGIEEWLGYDGLYPLRPYRFQRELGPDIRKAMAPACAIAYILNDPRYPPLVPEKKLAACEHIATHDGIEVYRDPAALPRARLVNKARVTDDLDAMFALMRSPAFDPAVEALLEAPPAGGLPKATRADPGDARIVGRQTTRVSVRVDAREAAILILADTHYPGWHAHIDGEPAAVFPVYSVFRGVRVPPGKHHVTFQYRPWSFRVGLALSMAALLALPAIALVIRRWRRTALE
ncbi:MAG: YfhO family protein [Candidatus Hydrogenedentota bacterium]